MQIQATCWRYKFESGFALRGERNFYGFLLNGTFFFTYLVLEVLLTELLSLFPSKTTPSCFFVCIVAGSKVGPGFFRTSSSSSYATSVSSFYCISFAAAAAAAAPTASSGSAPKRCTIAECRSTKPQGKKITHSNRKPKTKLRKAAS